MGLWLKNVEQMRHVNWGKTWLWDVKFPAGPERFREWFPASTVDENLFTLRAYDFTAGFSTYKLPKSSEAFTIRVTFFDDMYTSIEQWLSSWVNNEILGGGEYLRPLEEIVKEIVIAKLTGTNQLVEQNSYLVFPEGDLFFSGNSEPAIRSSEVEFVVAATLSKQKLLEGPPLTGVA